MVCVTVALAVLTWRVSTMSPSDPARRAQWCGTWHWAGTQLSLESYARIEASPWQGRPDTGNKGEILEKEIIRKNNQGRP